MKSEESIRLLRTIFYHMVEAAGLNILWGIFPDVAEYLMGTEYQIKTGKDPGRRDWLYYGGYFEPEEFGESREKYKGHLRGETPPTDGVYDLGAYTGPGA
jgi:hypothetical protein